MPTQKAAVSEVHVIVRAAGRSWRITRSGDGTIRYACRDLVWIEVPATTISGTTFRQLNRELQIAIAAKEDKLTSQAV